MILGIDTGSHVCGYAVLDDGAIVEIGQFKSGAKSTSVRLLSLNRDLEELLQRHIMIDLAGVESPYVGKFPGSVIGLSQARGVVLMTLAKFKITAMDISPSLAKKSVGCSGHAPKESVQRAVQALYGMDSVPPPDVADAIVVALAASSADRTASRTPR